MTSKMKSLARFGGLLGRSQNNSTPPEISSTRSSDYFSSAPVDSPQANVQQSIRLFCESGSMSNGGEEVLHLPVIVEAAESSPTAAGAAAHQIRKFLTKEWSAKPYVQYNAIMLIRILSDNPGPLFTRNFDKPFVTTVKELLRNCKDNSTQQILRETLDSLEANKSLQEGMEMMIAMWRKEKGHQARLSQGGYPTQNVYQDPYGGRPQPQQRSNSHQRQLPSQEELASRIEEAKNTAKILLQFIQSTPPNEVLNNHLLGEFAERCQTAQRSMQGYINCNAPPPDDDTMLTLIETNEQLSLALSRYQRALLSARKALGVAPSPNQNGTGATSNGPYEPPPQLPTQPSNGFGRPQQDKFAAPPPDTGESFTPPPPGPPPALLNRLNSREGQRSPPHSPQQLYNSPSQQQQRQQYPSPPPKIFPPNSEPSNPFADPAEYDPTTAPTISIQQPSHGRTFSNDSEPAPSSPERPALGAYHNSTITASYLGRQDDALQEVTMHGAQPDQPTPAEIDGHANVGRVEEREEDLYESSPVQRRGGGRF